MANKKVSELPVESDLEGLYALGVDKNNRSVRVLLECIQSLLSGGMTFGGIATPDTEPAISDQNVFYIATEPGTYANFGGITVNDGEAVILQWNNGTWSKNVTGFATSEKLTELESEIGRTHVSKDFIITSSIQTVCDINANSIAIGNIVNETNLTYFAITGYRADGSQKYGGTIYLKENYAYEDEEVVRLRLYILGDKITQPGNVSFDLFTNISKGILDNKVAIDTKVPKSDIVNTLFENSTDKVLSGKVGEEIRQILHATGFRAVTTDDRMLYKSNTSVSSIGFNTSYYRQILKMPSAPPLGDVSLQVNQDDTSYPLYYNGKRAGVDNNWSNGKTNVILDVYFNVSDQRFEAIKFGYSGLIDELETMFIHSQQGQSNVGKVLTVQSDGSVLPETPKGGGGGSDVSKDDVFLKEEYKVIKMNPANVAGNAILGGGWSGTSEFTHTAGSANALEFPINAADGDMVIVTFDATSITDEGTIELGIGDGIPIDIYNGTGSFTIGFIYGSGNLKFVPISSYAGTVRNIKCRVVNPEGTDSLTYSNKNVKGINSDDKDVTGFWNVAIGPKNETLPANQNGSRNIAIGLSALRHLVGGHRNICIGTFAGYGMVEGDRNVSVGADSLYGFNAAKDSVAVGKGALNGDPTNPTTKSTKCVAVGSYALSGNTGKDKTNCIAIGHKAGFNSSLGNVCIGSEAGASNTGSNNVIIGTNAAPESNSGGNSVYIGAAAKNASGKNPWNAIAIGYGAVVDKNNMARIGNASVDTIILGNKKLIFNEDGTVSWTQYTE
ncbi:MAG: hypothetical protein IAB99_07190 [Bacteroidetes bacterium]|uniref:Uncharacterized protein n=1 Tax=Candidatus Cryptobacteroides faecipullorum TaxID=2840764 RepID=A0A9D9I849_9BACT|nr:hypothetical protein [Candidatus Cryptobacteroides faecipullorum]